MSFTKFINLCILQFVGIRLTRWGYGEGSDFKQQGWGLLLGVLPFTGWSSRYIGWQKHIKLTGDESGKSTN